MLVVIPKNRDWESTLHSKYSVPHRPLRKVCGPCRRRGQFARRGPNVVHVLDWACLVQAHVIAPPRPHLSMLEGGSNHLDEIGAESGGLCPPLSVSTLT